MIPVSLQLWSVRPHTAADFAGTVARIAQMGYVGVETAGYGNTDATTAAKALRDNNLKVSGMHVSIDRLRNELGQVAVEAHLLEAKHIVCPYYPKELFSSGVACQYIGAELNQIGDRLRRLGFKLHYHNHAQELKVVDGRRVFDWILDAAEPQNLGCELDVYWSHVSGKPPADFIREHGRRIQLVHLKDEKELGTGPVDFAPIFTALETIGAVEWHVIEVERYSHDSLESVRLSLEQLHNWRRA